MQTDVATHRRELAAALRLAAKHDLNEGICNHFSVALPGKDERYLINPYGIHWAEMRPDDLLMIDGAGRVLEGEGEVRRPRGTSISPGTGRTCAIRRSSTSTCPTPRASP
jgi:ribulose-5-phosphate 4-epimerase/fuculose-1-phosphate aldolase